MNKAFLLQRLGLSLVMLLPSLFAAGCASTHIPPAGGAENATESAAAPAVADSSSGEDATALAEEDIELIKQATAETVAGYRLQPGDEIDVQVYREPDISGPFRLGQGGVIRHPLLGDVALAGLSVSEAEARFVELLGADYLVNPRVLIKVVNAQSSQIVIFGEVRKPGIYPVPVGERITLLQAIANAGGFTDLASPDRVRIVRKVDGKQTTIRARVADILGGRGKQGDIPLEPDDVIVVPQIIF